MHWLSQRCGLAGERLFRLVLDVGRSAVQAQARRKGMHGWAELRAGRLVSWEKRMTHGWCCCCPRLV